MTSNASRSRPIGVFDSGLGGLTIVQEIRRRLPSEDIVYFGDIARLPYGTKSKKQILEFSRQNIQFLKTKKVKAIVVACNSSSSAGFHILNRYVRVPLIDVIEPAAEAACRTSKSGRIGLIATQATIESGAYAREIIKHHTHPNVYQRSCALFVPLVEAGWLTEKVTEDVAKKYLAPLKNKKVDALILGCTHYPLIAPVIRKVMGKRVKLIDCAAPTVKKLASLLNRNGLIYPSKRKGRLDIYVSDTPRDFQIIGERFLGEKLQHVKAVRV